MSNVRVIHPLCGRACPTAGDLLRRADYDAAPVLEAACRLAGYRIELQTRAQALRDAWSLQPWGDDKTSFELPPAVLLPADMARALLAVAPQDVLDNLFHAFPHSPDVFDEARAIWRDNLAQTGSEVDRDLQLLRPWARRFAMTLGGDSPLGILQLLGHGTYMQFVHFSATYNEGLITEGETVSHLGNQLAMAVERLQVPWKSVEPALGRPYADWGLIAEFEAMLAEGPGVMLVGEPGCGRRSLLRICQDRHRRDEGPLQLRGFGFNVDRTYEAPSFHNGELRLPAEVDDRCVFALVEHGLAHLLDPSASGHDAWLATIQKALQICGHGRAGRLVLGVTPRQKSLLYARIPELRRLPVLGLPRPSRSQHVVFWLCRVFDIEVAADGPVDVARILWWLSRRAPEEVADFDRLADVAKPAPRHVHRLVQRAGEQPEKQWSGRLRRALDRLSIGPELFRQLLALEQQLFAADTG